jgi:hypothetical protein
VIDRRYPLVTFLKMEAPHLSRLEQVLRQSYGQVSESILGTAARSGVGAQVTRLQLEAQRAAIKSYLDRGFSDMEALVANGQRDAAVAASKVVSTYEETLTKAVLDPATRKAVRDAEANRAATGVRNAMQRIQGNSYIDLSPQVYRTLGVANGMVDRAVDTALARGLTWQEFAKSVMPLVDPNTPGGTPYAARRLARTEINNAFHASAAQRYADAPMVEGVDWNKSNSHPENDICDQLEDDSPYDVESVPAKPHPHCLCFITPALPSEDDFLDNLFAGKYDDATPTGMALTAAH